MQAASLIALIVGIHGSGAQAQTAIRDVNQDDLTVFPRNDDGSTAAVPLDFDLNFFGQVRSEAFVNNNGNITFDAALGTYTPFELTTTGREIVAPFFADVDTRSGGEPVRYGQTTIGGRRAFVVNYLDVDYYFSQADRTNLNSFQLVLIDRSDIAEGDADIEFNYETIVWETGTASDGDENGLGGSSARVGWSNGTGDPGTFFELPGSGEPGAFLDGGPEDTALVLNSLNANILGRYVFMVRGGTIDAFDVAPYLDSFRVLANDSAAALAEQQFAIGEVLSQGTLADQGRSVMSVRAAGRRTGEDMPDLGRRTTPVGALSFGYGVSDTLTLGGTISLNGNQLPDNGFDVDTGPGVALWAEYSEGGRARTGLQFGGAIGYARADAEISRGRLLANDALATGDARIETRAVQASLGYGFGQGDWLVTPSLGVAHYESRRDAYTESGAAFSASYESLRTSRTVATLGVTGETAVSDQGRLALGVGLDHELDPEDLRLSGTSDIPGLASFDVASDIDINRTRPFATAGYSHDFGDGSVVKGDLRVGRAVYGSTPSVAAGVTYEIRFRTPLPRRAARPADAGRAPAAGKPIRPGAAMPRSKQPAAGVRAASPRRGRT
jgi:hypothetical protein